MLKLGLSSNVRYTYDPAKPYGERITSVTINGEPLKADATYTVGSVTFLLAGGDSFEALTRGGAATTNGNLDRDSFNAYLGAPFGHGGSLPPGHGRPDAARGKVLDRPDPAHRGGRRRLDRDDPAARPVLLRGAVASPRRCA